MPLSRAERKDRLPFGSQREIARAVGVSEALVSLVVNELVTPITPHKIKTVRRIRVLVARKLRVPVAEAFPADNGTPAESPAA